MSLRTLLPFFAPARGNTQQIFRELYVLTGAEKQQKDRSSRYEVKNGNPSGDFTKATPRLTLSAARHEKWPLPAPRGQKHRRVPQRDGSASPKPT